MGCNCRESAKKYRIVEKKRKDNYERIKEIERKRKELSQKNRSKK